MHSVVNVWEDTRTYNRPKTHWRLRPKKDQGYYA